MKALNLKAWREHQGLTQHQAGVIAGLAVTTAERTWRKWENNEQEPPGCLPFALAYLESNPRIKALMLENAKRERQ